jgi:hypothetical protein
MCMTSGASLDTLTAKVFAAVTGDLDEAPTVTANHRRVLHVEFPRLAGHVGYAARVLVV